jgi:hypothetical protein
VVVLVVPPQVSAVVRVVVQGVAPVVVRELPDKVSPVVLPEPLTVYLALQVAVVVARVKQVHLFLTTLAVVKVVMV